MLAIACFCWKISVRANACPAIGNISEGSARPRGAAWHSASHIANSVAFTLRPKDHSLFIPPYRCVHRHAKRTGEYKPDAQTQAQSAQQVDDTSHDNAPDTIALQPTIQDTNSSRNSHPGTVTYLHVSFLQVSIQRFRSSVSLLCISSSGDGGATSARHRQTTYCRPGWSVINQKLACWRPRVRPRCISTGIETAAPGSMGSRRGDQGRLVIGRGISPGGMR
jgi:hypothetical protein